MTPQSPHNYTWTPPQIFVLRNYVMWLWGVGVDNCTGKKIVVVWSVQPHWS